MAKQAGVKHAQPRVHCTGKKRDTTAGCCLQSRGHLPGVCVDCKTPQDHRCRNNAGPSLQSGIALRSSSSVRSTTGQHTFVDSL
mmetsp:Transcript_11378/g.32661  ORF Transcript_11378/g.32661 Transcript_11378/m.32661 type:complete len:84 (-) Transcript_11378:6-257(-)